MSLKRLAPVLFVFALVLLFLPALAGAAAPAGQAEPGFFAQWSQRLRDFFSSNVINLAWRGLLALLLFLLGWLLAKLIAWIIFRLLCRTNLAAKLAEKLGVKPLVEEDEKTKESLEDKHALERGISTLIFYVLMLLVVVGVLQFVGLSQAAGPIQRLVDTVVQALPLVGKAILILVVAYIIAVVLRKGITRGLNLLQIDNRFAQLSAPKDRPEEAPEKKADEKADEKDADKEEKKADEKADEKADDRPAPGTVRPFSESVGLVVFWLVMVMGLAGAFDALKIAPLAIPLRNAIDKVISYLPQAGLAALLVVAGWILGRIVRAVVSNLLESVGFDRLIERLKLAGIFGASTASYVAGWIAMAFIVLQAAIAALNVLKLVTLSGPLTDMMRRFWTLLPTLAVAIIIVTVGVLLGRLVRKFVAAALRNLGFTRLMGKLGFEKVAERTDELGEPSELVGFVAYVAVILLAVAQALQTLHLTTWAGYVNAILVYGVTHAVVAILIIGVGFAIGNYVRDLINARQAEHKEISPKWLGEFARYAVLVFAFTMAVHQLGVAKNFVLLSFALLFGGLCVAMALAFGLGAKDVASEIVRKRYQKMQTGTPGPRTAGPGSTLSGTPGGKPPSAT